MNKSLAGFIAVMIFALATAGAFYWLWTTSKSEATSKGVLDSSYSAVEIDSVKKEAVDILSTLENKAAIPIPTPTDKMGRTNPYLSY
jgi:flagellar basal body-associated protein FliL